MPKARLLGSLSPMLVACQRQGCWVAYCILLLACQRQGLSPVLLLGSLSPVFLLGSLSPLFLLGSLSPVSAGQPVTSVSAGQPIAGHAKDKATHISHNCSYSQNLMLQLCYWWIRILNVLTVCKRVKHFFVCFSFVLLYISCQLQLLN